MRTVSGCSMAALAAIACSAQGIERTAPTKCRDCAPAGHLQVAGTTEFRFPDLDKPMQYVFHGPLLVGTTTDPNDGSPLVIHDRTKTAAATSGTGKLFKLSPFPPSFELARIDPQGNLYLFDKGVQIAKMRPREVEFSATAIYERVMVITRSLRSVVERYLRNVDYVAQDMLRKLAVIDAEAVALTSDPKEDND